MSKPYLLIVTGMPGAGKTTFAKKLGDEICMPVVSRDELKEGYVRSFGKAHAELPGDTNGVVTGLFFETLRLLVGGNVSVVAEAAFQHRLWSSMLGWFTDRARVSMLICAVSPHVARARYIRRGLDDGRRGYFHGDPGVDAAGNGAEASMSPYDEPRIDVPTFHIDTLNGYNPSVRELTEMIPGLAYE